MGAMTKKVRDKICELYRSDTYTASEVCSIVGVSRPTYYKYINSHQEYADAIEIAKTERMEFFTVEAKKSLLKKIRGYTIEEKKTVTAPSKILDKNGVPKPRIKEHTVTKKYVQPDTAAIIFTLTNGDPSHWKNRQYSEVTGKGGKDLFKTSTDEDLDEQINQLQNRIKGSE